MAKRPKIICDDCYFRQAGLCAIAEGPCPTYRSATTARLVPPPQPRLVARAGVQAAHAAA